MKRFGCLLLAWLLGAFMLAPLPATALDEDPGPGCAVTWGSAARQAAGSFGGSITDARTGRQDCYDRLVIDVSGAIGGYDVRYVDAVSHPASGAPVPLRGDGRLQVLIRATALDPNGNPTYAPVDPREAANVTGYSAFRQVAYAGTFEADTVFGVGVRERLPFRVLTLAGPGAGSRLVVDVAHAWLGAGTASASPFGNYESARAVVGGVEVKGWMIDPDTTGAIYAWVTLDGVGRHLFANASRPDVANVYPAYGPAHGFLSTIPASPGTHTVCVTASNVGPGSHTNLGCRTLSTASGSPFGNFERASAVAGGVEVKGWMIDPDTVNPIYAWVTLDGVGRHLFANASRPDVANVYPAYGPNHGFLGTIPASPGTHTVCVTASNVGPGSHTNLGCRTTVALSGSPFGNYESARAVVGGVEVKGWMIDPDTTDPIYAWVTVDGVGRHLFAGASRPDVANVYPAYGPAHGFLGTVPAAPGTRTVCVTASNVGPGSHTNLGCRTATVTGLSPSLLGTDWERIPTTAKVAALTFDGGSGDGAVASILSTLATKNVRATFFMTGNFARTFPARVAAITAGGHRLGNHSDTHASYPTLTNAQISADLARAEASIIAASGGPGAKPLFRFPFGERTQADIAAVNDAGYVPVRWTVDTLGWQGTSGGRTADSVLKRVLDTVTPGQIVLMHVGAHPTDGSTLDADALPRMIDELRARGYSFVTLDALLATP